MCSCTNRYRKFLVRTLLFIVIFGIGTGLLILALSVSSDTYQLGTTIIFYSSVLAQLPAISLVIMWFMEKI